MTSVHGKLATPTASDLSTLEGHPEARPVTAEDMTRAGPVERPVRRSLRDRLIFPSMLPPPQNQ